MKIFIICFFVYILVGVFLSGFYDLRGYDSGFTEVEIVAFVLLWGVVYITIIPYNAIYKLGKWARKRVKSLTINQKIKF